MADIEVKGLKELTDTLEKKLPKLMRSTIARAMIVALNKVVKPAVIAKISMYGLIETGRMIDSVGVGRGRRTSADVVEAIAGVTRASQRKRHALRQLSRVFGHRQSKHSILKSARAAGLNFANYAIPLERGFLLKVKPTRGKKKFGPHRVVFVPGFHFFQKAFNENIDRLLQVFVTVLSDLIDKELKKRWQYQ